MKLFTLVIFLLLSQGIFAQTLNQNDQALKQRFNDKHQALIPVVAVADMFFACNRQRHSDNYDYQIIDLVKKMDKGKLAEKLANCLAGESLKSDIALILV